MAIDAPPHIELVLRLDHLHPVDLTMAFGAIEAEGDMRLVAESRVIGKVVDLNPFYRFTRFPGLAHFLNLWTLSLHQAVAVHARVDSGH